MATMRMPKHIELKNERLKNCVSYMICKDSRIEGHSKNVTYKEQDIDSPPMR